MLAANDTSPPIFSKPLSPLMIAVSVSENMLINETIFPSPTRAMVPDRDPE